MKPKSIRIAKTIPAIITLVMASAGLSNAEIIFDTDGSIIIDTTNDGDNSALADGGANPFVDILAGANITGHVTSLLFPAPTNYVIQTTGLDDYTITNDGTVAGTAGHTGIIVNSGTGTVINNNGDISSADRDAVLFNLAGGTVNNSDGSTITSGTRFGIRARADLTVVNEGDITATTASAIVTDNNATITNLGTGSILGYDNGIQASNDLTVENAGEITGDINGISSGDGLILSNDGAITGGDGTGRGYAGVQADDDAKITNNANGTITGDFFGIDAFNGLILSNEGTISGVVGIETDENANIVNSGTIRGTGSIAIEVLNDSSIVNTGTIISDTFDAVSVFGAGGSTFTLTNSGLIQAADGFIAVYTDSADDTLNLILGSQIVGDINGTGGNDVINLDGGLTSPLDAADGVLSNSILGNVYNIDTINKTGTGVAFIGTPNDGLNLEVNADEINIAGGGLYINADISAEDGVSQSVITAGGAALGGTGTWNADIFVTSGGFSAGAIPINLDANPVNSVGTVTVNGNVDHSPGTFIRFDVIPGTVINSGVNNDLIVQTGAMSFYDVDGANVRISPTSNNTPITAGSYEIIRSEGTITGTPGSLGIQFNPNVNASDTDFRGTLTGFTGQNVTDALLVTDFATLRYLPNIGGIDRLTLSVDRDFSSLNGLSGNSFATALDASLNVPELQDFIAALDYSTLADVQDIFGAITTLDTFSTAAALVSSNYQTHRVVQDHLAMARSQGGETIIETAPAMTDSKGGMIPAQTTSTGGASSMGNVWGSFSYDWRDSSGFGAGDIDGEEASFLAGVDFRVAPNFLLGILLEGSTADYDFAAGGSDIDTFRAAIYGTYGAATGFYTDFLVGYGDHSFDSSRNSILGLINTDTDATSIQAMLTFGYAMQSGAVKHGPFGGIEYTNIDVDGYNQGGILPFGVSDYDVESTRLLIGYRAEAAYGRFSPYASVSYAHELKDGQQNAIGTLPGPGGATFGITGGSLDSAFLISVGTGYAISDNLGLNVGYHGEISTGDGIDSHGATIGLNYAF